MVQGDERLYVNRYSKKVHKGNKEKEGFTACHYYLSSSFEQMTVGTDLDDEDDMKLCKRCFGRKKAREAASRRSMGQPLIDNLVEFGR